MNKDSSPAACKVWPGGARLAVAMKSITYPLIALSLLAMASSSASDDDVAREVKADEHCNANDLFPTDETGCRAQRSGDWSDPETWESGRLPHAGARVWIPGGITVRIQADQTASAIEWIRVDGALVFARDRNTALRVGTIFVGDDGLLEIGDAEERIRADAAARIVFSKREARAVTWKSDPGDLGGGLICFGRMQVHGSDKLPFVVATTELRKGVSSLEFELPARGWRVGDQLVLPGLSYAKQEDEVCEIASISADRRRVDLATPLKFDHDSHGVAPVPIGNLTRNVRFESEAGADPEQIPLRGHIMIMHRQTGTHIEGAEFRRLGRTDAGRVHTRPQQHMDGSVIEGSDDNPIGRYALHFHGRTGARLDVPAQVVRNCVITDSPKHGLVNHGGHVLAQGNVTYKVRGSHFFCENGSEIGEFRDNLAIRSAGTGEDLKSRMYSFDLGHTGHGFWLQGGGVEVRGNYAFGHRDAAFIFHMKPHMLEGDQPVRFLTANLPDPSIAEGVADMHPADVPIRFSENVAAGSGSGLAVRYHKREAKHGVPSIFERSVIWNTSMERTAVDLDYSKGVTLRDLVVLGDLSDPRSAGILTNGESADLVCERLHVSGFATGIVVPRQGTNLIRDCRFNNELSIFVQEAVAPERDVVMESNHFMRLPLVDSGRLDIALVGREDCVSDPGQFPVRWHATEQSDLSVRFTRDRVMVDGYQIFYKSQGQGDRPFGRLGVAGLESRTSLEVLADYGLAVAGCLAPPDAAERPGIFGLVGLPAMDHVSSEPPRLVSPRWTRELNHYEPVVMTAAGAELRGEPVQLIKGWNLVPIQVEGVRHTELVFGDTDPPRLRLANAAGTIHPSDVSYGYLVAGRLLDRHGRFETDRKFRRFYPNLPTPVGGVIEFDVAAVDLAGNEVTETVRVRVTDGAFPRQANIDQGRLRADLMHGE